MLCSLPRRALAVVRNSDWLLRSSCSRPSATFATKGHKKTKGSARNDSPASSQSSKSSSSPASSSSSSSATTAATITTPPASSMTRAAYKRAASLLSSSTSTASSSSTSSSSPAAPSASASPSSNTARSPSARSTAVPASPRTSAAPAAAAAVGFSRSTRPFPSSSAAGRRSSLQIPLRAGIDVVDPMVAYSVDRMSLDDIIEQQLLSTTEKLVQSKSELAAALTQEKRDEKRARDKQRRWTQAALTRRVTARDTTLAPGEQFEQLVDHIDVQSQNEKLELDNPESMRRQKAMELKNIKISIAERLDSIEDNIEQQNVHQFTQAEKERAERVERMKRVERGEQDFKQANADYFDPMRRVRDEEARLALEAARLRENAVFRYKEQYGEREGDDYALPAEEDEKLFEQDDQEVALEARPAQISALVPERQVDKQGRSFGSGARKSATAQVWLKPGTGQCKVNGVLPALYFDRWIHRASFVRPFEAVGRLGVYDVVAVVKGGGKTGQSGAAELGIARALVKQEPLLRERLKELGFLTRDTRKKERRKPGQPKARKQYTFVKR